jgi:YVTN family beta-propeller protein
MTRVLPAAILLVWIPVLMAAQSTVRDTLLIVPLRVPGAVAIYKTIGNGLTLLKTLPVGKTPREVCVSSNGKRAYVSNQEGNSVTVLDLDALGVAATITHPNLMTPDGCTVSPDSKKLYMTASGKDEVFVISTETNQVVKEIPIPLSVLRRATFSPDGNTLYVTCNKTQEIAVIDPKTDTVRRTIKVGNENRGGLAFTPDGKTFVAGSVEDDTLYFVDAATEKIERIIGIPGSPQRIEITPTGHIFVLCRIGQKLASNNQYVPVLFGIFNPDKHDESKSLPVGQLPWGLAMTRDGRRLYVSSNTDNSIMVIDGETMAVLNTVTTDRDPQAIGIRQ